MTKGLYSKSKEHRKKLSESLSGKMQMKNYNLDNISTVGTREYREIHRWIRSVLGAPMICFFCLDDWCSDRSYNWANLSHEYKRDVSDWTRLCKKCHWNYDHNRISSEKMKETLKNNDIFIKNYVHLSKSSV